jgi:serine/threonine protein kinase
MGQEPIEGALQPGHVLHDRYQVLGSVTWREFDIQCRPRSRGMFPLVLKAQDIHPAGDNDTCCIEVHRIASPYPISVPIYMLDRRVRDFESRAERFIGLNHVHLAKLRDYFVTRYDDWPSAFVVYDSIEGVCLYSIICKIGQLLPTAQVLKWAADMCDVLSALHNHSSGPIFFRDLCPNNVIVDDHNHLHLVDFNLGRTINPPLPFTFYGQLLGAYAPRETHSGSFVPASDIYSLGATLHHLLTRIDPRLEPPFSFEDRPIRDYNPDVPEAFAAIVMRALAYDPADRFATAEEMKQALEALDG